MKTHKAWRSRSSTLYEQHSGVSADLHRKDISEEHTSDRTASSVSIRSADNEHPWSSPRTVFEEKESHQYRQLQGRLTQIPSRSKQKRQKIFVDLWTGQHWLSLAQSGPDGNGILKPINVDTALSITTFGNFRLVSKSSYAQHA